jgi:hypothetical protein
MDSDKGGVKDISTHRFIFRLNHLLFCHIAAIVFGVLITIDDQLSKLNKYLWVGIFNIAFGFMSIVFVLY